MKNVRHDEQLRISTVWVVFVHVAHVWGIMRPETENQALYDDLFRGIFGLVFGVAIVESVRTGLWRDVQRVSISGVRKLARGFLRGQPTPTDLRGSKRPG